jgi:hypothetical protein
MAKFIGMSSENEIEFPGFDDILIHPWKTIQKFSEIDLSGVNPEQTIVLCDIDDTLLHHPFLSGVWAAIMTEFFVEMYFAETNQYNREAGMQLADEYSKKIIREIPMQHTDRYGFFDLLNKVGKLMFITARFPEAEEFTRENLLSIGVNSDLHEIRFTGSRPKGEYIQTTIDLTPYTTVLFIDDQTRNLENVHSFVFHPDLRIYKFDREKEDPDTYYPFPPGFNRAYRFNGSELVLRSDT